MTIGQYHVDAADSELAGAVKIGPHVEPIQARVLDLFRMFGNMTDEEMRERYIAKHGFVDKNVVEPRRTELVMLGKLRKTDERRKGKSGIGRIAWALVQSGEQLRLI